MAFAHLSETSATWIPNMTLSKYLPARAAKGDPSMKSFQSLVGSLLWIARCTRPDICFAVHKATRRTHKPTLQDWKTAKRILRYLNMSKNLKLYLGGDGLTSEDIRVECWSDADFAADKAIVSQSQDVY